MQTSRKWIPKYWQWIYSSEELQNPLKTGKISCQSDGLDSFLCFPCTGGGEDCGRVVNLSGSDAKRPILIPVFVAAYNSAELDDDLNRHELLEIARGDVREPLSLELTVNGEVVEPQYLESEGFQVSVLQDNHRQTSDEERYETFSAGYWRTLEPLSDGRHIIQFGGKGRNGFMTKVRYEVTVTN